ncbi:radical SAM/SPASM domain-containing protein [Streptomyces sp. NPDC059256]|uniref:radical SAM/SPASM domain-containing protein n=1 Tax=Streptomyces sp. NPDC059256 TaxID=3346794 RepID=UPI003681926B
MTLAIERPMHPAAAINTLELEITGKCQLSCTHCLSESSPQATHGTMTPADWRQVITDAAALGIPRVQLIGGEPTVHPQWRDFTEHALALGLRVQVYSNLFNVAWGWWSLLERPGVSLATSYYSDDPEEHDRITGKQGSYWRTQSNIEEALRRGIPLYVGIVDILDGQRVSEARAELVAMGVKQINTDRVRAVGRGALSGQSPSLDELCGRCTRGRAAVLPNGDLAGCVLARNFPCGNVRVTSLAQLFSGEEWASLSQRIPAPRAACPPDDSGDCDPANTEACDPAYEDE